MAPWSDFFGDGFYVLPRSQAIRKPSHSIMYTPYNMICTSTKFLWPTYRPLANFRHDDPSSFHKNTRRSPTCGTLSQNFKRKHRYSPKGPRSCYSNYTSPVPGGGRCRNTGDCQCCISPSDSNNTRWYDQIRRSGILYLHRDPPNRHDTNRHIHPCSNAYM